MAIAKNNDRNLQDALYTSGIAADGRNNKEIIYAAIYARVSSPTQRFGYSLDEQVRRCRERCDLMKWKVRYIFEENGESGANTDRPKFQMMLQKAREGAFDVLVFWKLDRFCRSLADVVNIERELGEYGVSLHSITEQIDTTTPVGKFNFRNLASASELERDLIKERVKMGMIGLAMQHKWPNKQPPLGYDKTEYGKLKPNEEEVKLVREIFEMYLKLRSMPQVAYELNRRGIKTKMGGEWTAPSLKQILDNKLYIGKYEVAGIEAYVEEYKILDERLFERALSLRKRSRKEREPMPKDRKEETIERVFNEYLEMLREEEKQEFRIL